MGNGKLNRIMSLGFCVWTGGYESNLIVAAYVGIYPGGVRPPPDKPEGSGFLSPKVRC
jgi:hypothetical protein